MTAAELRIRTPEGIVFAHRLAGPLPRAFAWITDLAIVLTISNGLAKGLGVLNVLSEDISKGLLVVAYFVVSTGYHIVLEWFWRGQTLGKRLFKLRVADAEGLRLGFYQVVMRNLVRFVDQLPAFYLVGGAACLVNRHAQRLGDLAAGTVVIHLPKHAEPDLDQLLAGKFNSLRAHPHLEARLRQRVSPDEARLALQALVRRDELDPVARVSLFTDLAEHFKTLVTFPPEDTDSMPDEQYVRNVVDILFRTRAKADS
jgi:uncharacterized RDD family membrane protein YckC